MKILTNRTLWMNLIVGLCIVFAGCTIVREVENNGGNGDNGDNANSNTNYSGEVHFNDIPIEADIVDAMVVVDLSRGSTGIMNGYYSYIAQVEAALVAQGVFVRDLAVVPMYRQQNHRPPLLYGRGDENNLRPGLEDTLLYYFSDDGKAHLGDRVDAPGENAAALGMNLDRETVFNPESGSGDGSSYYREPEDGFVVFHVTGGPRECSHGDSDCALEGQTPAEFFSDTNADDEASWLNLPGSGLAPDDIVHISIATDEGVSFDDFSDSCSSRPDFPTRYLDHLEPSSEHHYFGPFIDDIDSAGGHSREVEMCDALSSELLDGAALRTSNTIAGAIR